jgi:nucleotide-binding universal stress UspA family protein
MQIRKILAAVKPTSPEPHPLCTALELAGRADARVTVLAVTESPWELLGPAAEAPGAAMSSRGELVALAAARLRDRVQPLVPAQLGKRMQIQAAIGLPAIEIPRRSESEGADLIVLGREASSHMPRVDGADTIEGTVRRARVPCLLVPQGGTPFRRILAAVDGGPETEDVIAAAQLFGSLFGASVRALEVESRALAGVGAATGARHVHPGACEVVVREGDPVTEIVRMVREDAIDLLVFGHHRGGPVGAHATSGVAPRLLQRAPCAVLTVPI